VFVNLSLFCVIILASPLANPAITRQIRGTVLWNSTFAVIAIVSTAASLLYFIVDSQPADNIESNGIEGQSYTPFFLLSRIGTVDIFINFNCVCVTWPFKFYWKVIIVILSSLADDVLFCAFSDIRM